MFKTIIICGPTAVGKTDFAVKIAPQLNGEIISADSRQAYRGLDVGTGKDISPTAPFVSVETLGDYSLGYYPLKSTKIWLYDLVLPTQPISVALYYAAWQATAARLISQSLMPITVGGTGFYLQNLLHPAPSLAVPPNYRLRHRLGKLTLQTLQQELMHVNPSRWKQMNQSDRANPRRLIRAIEVGQAPPTAKPASDNYDVLCLGLIASSECLCTRIKARVYKRLEQGFENEVIRLRGQYPAFSTLVSGQTLGYQQWNAYLDGRITREAAIEQWITAETQYMKRQLTWFKKQPKIHWFDIESHNWYAQATTTINQWIRYGN